MLPDLLKEGEKDLVNDLIYILRRTIGAGKKVIVRQEYAGAPPEDVEVFSTQDELDEYVRGLDIMDRIISKE